MPNRNFIFALIIISALIIVLIATGAAPLLWQLGTNIVQAIASAVQRMFAK